MKKLTPLYLAMITYVAGLLFVGNIYPANAAAGDVSGSADYPELGRFEGSSIVFYKLENYGKTTFATGPVRSKKDADTTSLEIEGKITRILYKVPKGTSALEVFRNFQKKAEDNKFNTAFSGEPNDFNKYDLVYNHPVEIIENISVTDEIYYLYSHRALPDSEKVYLSVLVSPHSGGDGLRVRVIVAETKEMEFQMIDAEAMGKDIGETGKVVLYGIYFDHDKTEVKPESKPTLDAIANLLASDPALKLIVVGHTDSTGGYDYNMDLSARRAESIKQVLVGTYRIAARRLRSAGVGYLAPAAANSSEAGKAKNRRVELIKDG